jgi:tight adherence protein C
MPLYVLIALIFVGVFSLLFFLMYVMMPKKTMLQERIENLSASTEAVLTSKPATPFQKFLGRLGANVPLRIEDYGKYSRRLLAAGMKKERVPVFIGAKIFLAALFPALYLIFYGMPVEKDPMSRMLISIVFAIIGFLLPSLWLSNKVKKRQLQIFFDLPDVLDLMTVCVEAGLSMDAAMIAITEELSFKKSPLVSEMKTVLRETRAGKQRAEALRDMGERCMVDDLKAFVTMLIQTERLGTSLAQSLRVHSDSFRKIRMQRAEEAAAKTAIKLLFPLVFFILPALFVVMLLPAVIRMAKILSAI